MTKQPVKTEGQSSEISNVTVDAAGGVGNVNQIRDILFGGQMREYERRFARFEARLDQEMAGLREDMRRQIEVLENYAKKEFAAFTEQMAAEQQKRERSLDALADQVKQLGSELKEKLAASELDTQKNFREMRYAMLDQAKSLSDEADRKIAAAVAALDRAERELRGAKMDRTTLSNLLSEMAMRISDEEGFAGMLASGGKENG